MVGWNDADSVSLNSAIQPIRLTTDFTDYHGYGNYLEGNNFLIGLGPDIQRSIFIPTALKI